MDEGFACLLLVVVERQVDKEYSEGTSASFLGKANMLEV